jgi:alpha/beta superfamily hydrolase
MVVLPNADHFFEGQLERLGETIAEFLASLAAAPRPAAGAPA